MNAFPTLTVRTPGGEPDVRVEVTHGHVLIAVINMGTERRIVLTADEASHLGHVLTSLRPCEVFRVGDVLLDIALALGRVTT